MSIADELSKRGVNVNTIPTLSPIETELANRGVDINSTKQYSGGFNQPFKEKDYPFKVAVDTIKWIGEGAGAVGDALESPIDYIIGGNKQVQQNKTKQHALDAMQEVETLDKSSLWSEVINNALSTKNPEDIQEAQKARHEQLKAYDGIFKQRGLGTIGKDGKGDLFLITKDGENLPLDGIVGNLEAGISANKGVAAGSVAGAIKGAKYAPSFGNPYLTALSKTAGTVIGGGIGAFGGSLADTGFNSYTTGKKFDGEFALKKAGQEALVDGAFSLGIPVAGKVLKTGLKLGGKTVQGAKTIKDYLLGENLSGAKTLAKDSNIDASAIHAQRTLYEETPRGLDLLGIEKQQDELASAAMTDGKLWETAGKGVKEDPIASANTLESINTRAKGVLEMAEDGSLDAKEVRNAILDYEKTTIDNYGAMIDDLHEMFPEYKVSNNSLLNIAEKAKDEIISPETEAILNSAKKQLSKKESLTIEGLYKLRKTINEKNISKHTSAAFRKEFVTEIDNLIGKAVDTLPEGDLYKKGFAELKNHYHNMFKMRESKAYQRIMKEDISQKGVGEALFKDSKAIEDSLNNITGVMSPGKRAGTEMRIISDLVKKAVVETKDGLQKSINFKELKKMLDAINLDNIKSVSVKQKIIKLKELSRIFRQDAQILADIKGFTNVQGLTGGIATTIDGRLKAMRVSMFMRIFRLMMPNIAGNNFAFARHVTRSLRKARTTKELLQSIESFPDIPPTIWESLKGAIKQQKEITKLEERAKLETKVKQQAEQEEKAKTLKAEKLAKQETEAKEVTEFKKPNREELDAVKELTSDNQYGSFGQKIVRIMDGSASESDKLAYIQAKNKIGAKRLQANINETASYKKMITDINTNKKLYDNIIKQISGEPEKIKKKTAGEIEGLSGDEDAMNQAYRDRFNKTEYEDINYYTVSKQDEKDWLNGTADKDTQHRLLNEIKRAIDDGFVEKKDIITEILSIKPKPMVVKKHKASTEAKPAIIEGEGTTKDALDFFKKLTEEADTSMKVSEKKRYKVTKTTNGEDIAARVFPAFQGNKKEMSRFAHKLIQDKMSVVQRAGITVIDDNFGGSGSWNIYLASTDLFPNVKKIRINEFDPERLQRIETLQHNEGIVKKYLDGNMETLQHEFDNMISAKHKDYGNNSLTGDVQKNTSGGSFENRLLELSYSETDKYAKASLKFMADVIGRGVKTDNLKYQLYRIAKQADSIAREVKKLKAKGVEFEYVNSSAFELQREQGKHVLTLYDPPYYGTAGYDVSFNNKGKVKKASSKVKQWMYDLVEQDISKLKELNHNVLYTDENWWNKTTLSGDKDLPKDMAEVINGTNALEKRDKISENFTHYNDSIPIAQRQEILALRIADEGNNARTTKASNKRDGGARLDTSARSKDGASNNGTRSNSRGKNGDGKQNDRGLDTSTKRKSGATSGSRNSTNNKELNSIIDSLKTTPTKKDLDEADLLFSGGAAGFLSAQKEKKKKKSHNNPIINKLLQ